MTKKQIKNIILARLEEYKKEVSPAFIESVFADIDNDKWDDVVIPTEGEE